MFEVRKKTAYWILHLSQSLRETLLLKVIFWLCTLVHLLDVEQDVQVCDATMQP